MSHRSRRLLVSASAAALVTLTAASAPAGAAPVLPDGRAYERVSQQDTKAVPAYQVGTAGIVIDDDHVVLSYGPMPTQSSPSGALDTYRFSRTSTGWVAESLLPADADPNKAYRLLDGTNDLSRSVFVSSPAELFTAPPSRAAGTGILVRDADGSFTTVIQDPNQFDGSTPGGSAYGGLSADGGTMLLSTYASPPGTTDVGGLRRAYRWTTTSGFERLAGADDDPTAGCEVNFAGGDGPASGSAATNNVSANGDTFFVMAQGGGAGCPETGQPFAVRDGQTTSLASPTKPGVAADGRRPAAFIGATPDGSTAYFVSNARLDPADALTPAGSALGSYDLYRWTAAAGGTPADVSCVTCAPGGASERFLDPRETTVSRDGSVVYFTATGVVGGVGVAGRKSLFVFADGRISLVATGNVSIVDGRLMLSSDGRRAAFANNGIAYTSLLDGNAVSVECLSCEADGTTHPGGPVSTAVLRPNPNSGARGASTISGASANAIADDGTVLFATETDLAAGTPLDAVQLFRWRPGAGSAPVMAGFDDEATGVNAVQQLPGAISPSGASIFGFSYDKLTADTTQESRTLFVARIGGGFPPPAGPAAAPCSGDACQGAPTAAPGSRPVGSSAPAAVGNATPGAEPSRRATVRLASLSATQRRALATRGRTRIGVRVRGAGRLTIRSTARIAGRTLTIARAGGTARGASSTVRTTLRLSSRARTELRRRGRLRVTTTVSLPDATSVRVVTTLSRKRTR